MIEITVIIRSGIGKKEEKHSFSSFFPLDSPESCHFEHHNLLGCRENLINYILYEKMMCRLLIIIFTLNVNDPDSLASDKNFSIILQPLSILYYGLFCDFKGLDLRKSMFVAFGIPQRK